MGINKLNKWIVFLILILAVFYYAGLLEVIFKKIKETTSTIELRVEVAAEEINKKLPVDVIGNISLVRVESSFKNIYFKYLVAGVDSSLVDIELWETKQHAIQKDDICNGDNKELLEDGAGFIFEYYDFSNIRFATVSISKDDC